MWLFGCGLRSKPDDGDNNNNNNNNKCNYIDDESANICSRETTSAGRPLPVGRAVQRLCLEQWPASGCVIEAVDFGQWAGHLPPLMIGASWGRSKVGLSRGWGGGNIIIFWSATVSLVGPVRADL